VLQQVDLQCWSNNHSHHTAEVDTERLLLRRGQPFTLSLRVNPPPRLTLVLHLGKDGNTVIKVSDSWGSGSGWWFRSESGQDELLLTVHSPPDAPVGLYHLTAVILDSDDLILQSMPLGQFHLLFNPWCKDDLVYLPEEEQLQEYILNESGLLYQGSWDQISAMPWDFGQHLLSLTLLLPLSLLLSGQFERDVVDICFQILDKSPAAQRNPQTDAFRRSDPVYVSRILTAMARKTLEWCVCHRVQVNANDDLGVVSGRWDGDYSDGVAPTRWSGSVPILRQWSRGGAQRVRYGQCWVFSGVACTVLRCLGIPTRCVTNYSSAHDTDGNLTVDLYYSEQLDSLPGGKKDMIWNYHCWVESWMARPDLPPGYDGWQVLDPTPQERSNGVYCCGPCPVRAIKEGDVEVKYDVPFVFSEVNADLVCWVLHADGRRSQVSLQRHTVGRNISTKSVSGEQREDLTQHYKYPEGSAMERLVYKKAGRKLSLPDTSDRKLELGIRHAQAVHGTDFDVLVEVTNPSGQDAHAHLTISALAVTYNGIHLGECHRKSVSLTLPANIAHREVLRLQYEHYGNRLSEHHLIRVTALLEPNDGHDIVLHETNIPLSVPQLTVQLFGEAVVSQKLVAKITFVNPLPITLKGGVFTVEGAGLTQAQEIPALGEIRPGEEVSIKFSFKPFKPGPRKLLVDFDTDRLKDVKGFAKVIVRGTNM
ncbi:TGM2 glutamyltransferase, partial [Amia calva]|nr:TGM2 glutamyltransferase [Amia calva]